MSSPLQSGLLHHNQVLTVKKAACWVQYLIDHHTRNIERLVPFALEASAVQSYAEGLKTILQHAGELEQLLCRMCMFLPDDVVQTVVAIVVATHRQLSMIESCRDTLFGECIVLDQETLDNMSEFLKRVIQHLIAANEWLHSDDYERVTRAVNDTLDNMRASFAAFLAQRYGSLSDVADVTSHPASSLHDQHNSTPTSPYDGLDSLLVALSNQRYDDVASMPAADWEVLTRNFTPLVLSDSPPYSHPDFYVCADTDSVSHDRTPSPSMTAYSGSPGPSRKGKERCLSDSSCESLYPESSHSSSTSTASTSWSSTPPMSPSEASSVVPQVRTTRTGLKRSRARSESCRPTKRLRVHARVYGIDECLSDCDSNTHERVVEQVRPFLGKTAEITPDLSPLTIRRAPFPILCDTSSPSPPRLSTPPPDDGMVSPYPSPSAISHAPFRPTDSPFALPSPSTEAYAMDDDVFTWEVDMDGSDTSSYVTAPDVEHMAEDTAPAPVAVSVDLYTVNVPLQGEVTRVKSKRRRCFANLFRTVTRIFNIHR
ncbi:hypothetical protein C8Q74DRAFT_897603 [Fomes fomentarius]|nr:hypothetical protein C8Q74DRAFT_897603 [Fomes fomentarius]